MGARNARGLRGGPLAASTRRAYAADVTAFVAWCARTGHAAFPASVTVVAAYLHDSRASYTYGTLRRRLAAIARASAALGAPLDTKHPGIRAATGAADPSYGAPLTLAAATRRSYAADVAAFEAWCAATGHTALPATPAVVANYLRARLTSYAMGTLRRKISAIAHASAEAGAPLDMKSGEILQALRGIGAEGEPARIATPLTIKDLRRLVAGCGSDLAGLRDRALLVVGFAGALRRAELVAIQHEHLVEVASGLKLILEGRANAPGRRPKGEILMARAQRADICPVRVVRAWLAVSGIEEGPVFRKVGRGGVLGKRGLSADAVRQILLRCAAKVGLKGSPQQPITPHGLRSGFVTSAYLSGVPEDRIMAQAGHSNPATMRRYRRRAKLGRLHP